jgi:hypothetical protein
VQRGYEVPGRRVPRGTLDVLGQLRRAEAAQRQAPRRGLAGDLRQRRGQGGVGNGVDVAVGAHDEHAHDAELAGEEAQEQQRRGVRCVQVVEHDHQRSARGRGAQELRRRVEQAKARAVGLESREFGEIWKEAPHLGYQLR